MIPGVSLPLPKSLLYRQLSSSAFVHILNKSNKLLWHTFSFHTLPNLLPWNSVICLLQINKNDAQTSLSFFMSFQYLFVSKNYIGCIPPRYKSKQFSSDGRLSLAFSHFFFRTFLVLKNFLNVLTRCRYTSFPTFSQIRVKKSPISEVCIDQVCHLISESRQKCQISFSLRPC